MLNLTPKEIDELFKAGSEQYDFEYNPVAWAQMEQLLDKEKRKRFILWWFWSILIGVSLLFMVWGVYLFANKILFPDLPKENSKQTVLPVQTILDSCLYIDSSSVYLRPFNLPSETDILEQQLIAQVSERSKTNDKLTKSFLKQEQRLDVEEQASNLVIPSPEPDTTINAITTATSTDSIFVLAAVEYLTPTAVTFPAIVQLIPDSIVPKLASIATLEPEKESGTFLFGVQTTAELTGAGNWSNFSDWGWKAGVALEYTYHNKWSANLGLLYSYKPYVAGGEDYKPDADYYPPTLSKKIESAKGVCDILEIPLELGYYFKGFAGNSFFAKAGLNSYWMVRERYDLTYKYPDSTQVSDIAVYNENKHWLAIGQLSLGYQRRIHNNWNVQIVPYMQFPLSGVGEGNIELYSIGTTFRCYFSKAKL